MKQETYEMVFVSLTSDIPVDVRLRHVLKSLLRQHRFRCKSVKRVEAKAKRTPKNKSMGRMVHHGATAKRAMPSESGRRRPVAPQTSRQTEAG